ncbi:MAG TPA: radical SAM protein [Kofleriaceae bacterium]|nr:radical SAM protein [Kofleriaceae bacterium]
MGFRAFPLDGSLLRFDRATGENQLWTGDETAAFRQRAPRVLQVAITNACNKSCTFCYRPLDARSTWTFDALLELARFADRWGVLELAFGGGEPTVFPRFAELVRAIWDETALCPSFTTNGSRLTPELLRELRGRLGQIQLSIYDDDDYLATIELLAAERVRFGLNYLVTPARLATLEADVAAFAARGVRDILLLSYKGRDPALHLTRSQQARFDEGVARMYRVLPIDLKVDVCWGHRLRRTPRLFDDGDCGAGSLFLSITSDRRALACSFADDGVAFDSPAELPAIWAAMRSARPAAPKPGCARLPRFGLSLPVVEEQR